MQFQFSVKKGVPYSIYIWNPGKTAYSLKVKKIVEQRVTLPKLWNDASN